jgi:hypothetical protein
MERWKKLALVVGILFILLSVLAYLTTTARRAPLHHPFTDISLAQRAEILRQAGLYQPLVIQYGAFLALALAGGGVLTAYWLSGQSKPAAPRGRALTIVLWLVLILNPLLSLFYLINLDSLGETVPSMPIWSPPVLIVAGLAAYVFALALWRWKKWGFYGIALIGLLAFVVNVASRIPWPLALLGLLGTGLLGLLLYPVWPQME